jgi:ribosomal protein L31E
VPPRSRPQVKDFAKKAMKTSEVRVDVKLNKHIWSKGVRNVRRRALCRSLWAASQHTRHAWPPARWLTRAAAAAAQVPTRVRVQISRRRNDDEDAKARGATESCHRAAARLVGFAPRAAAQMRAR